jgi:molecular chaperone GrpE
MKEKDNLEQEDILKDTGRQEDIPSTDMESEKNADSSDGNPHSDNVDEKLKAENQDLKEKYLRLYSEFENYRRRTSKERLELIKTASEDVIKELLPILDDFERAIKADERETSDTLDEGKKLIYNKLVKTLTSKGLRPMEELVGQVFDADMHEAITQIPAPSDDLKGKIVDVVERGYLLGDKVVRYAKVVIGQ